MSHPAGCQCGDDDAHVILAGTQDFLFDKIDRDRVVALNGASQGRVVIKPWDQRATDEPVSACLRGLKPEATAVGRSTGARGGDLGLRG